MVGWIFRLKLYYNVQLRKAIVGEGLSRGDWPGINIFLHTILRIPFFRWSKGESAIECDNYKEAATKLANGFL